jgi:glutamate formiminotransferase
MNINGKGKVQLEQNNIRIRKCSLLRVVQKISKEAGRVGLPSHFVSNLFIK